jgi:hypothetical protein
MDKLGHWDLHAGGLFSLRAGIAANFEKLSGVIAQGVTRCRFKRSWPSPESYVWVTEGVLSALAR